MSEYQYYEFQAIDRPLSEADRQALRDLSSRGRITATSFTNSYQWGDFKGDPAQLMRRCFDLHLYLANWGSRRLMIRLPARLVDRQRLDAFLGEVDCAELTDAGEYLVLDVVRDEVEDYDDGWDDGSGRLAALAPLRADVLSGDLRLFYLLWLTAVETDAFEDDEPEPMPGIGPMTGALEAFAEFFAIDPDLVDAAAERSAVTASTDADSRQRIISALSGTDKTAMLMRLFDGDPHVALELRAKVRNRLATSDAPPAIARTVGELRARALTLGRERERAAAEALAAEQKRQAEEAEKVRRARLVAIRGRGEGVWREVESEIERRNASGYEKATDLLADLRALADEQGAVDDYRRRLHGIRERHAGKRTFIERLARLG